MKVFVFFLMLIATWGLIPSRCCAQPVPNNQRIRLNSNFDKELAHQMRRADVQRDRTQIEALLRVAREDNSKDHIFLALRVLSRLGEGRALPIIAEMTELVMPPSDKDYFQILRARLLVEQRTEGRKSRNLDEAQGRLALFFQTLNLNVEQFVREHEKDCERKLIRKGERGGNIHDKNWLILREIADLIYVYKDDYLLRVVNQAHLDLERDRLTNLKIRLALLSTPRRIQLLIEELDKRRAADGDVPFISRLLADYGDPAQTVIASRLQQIASNRAEFSRNIVHNLIVAYASFRTGRRKEIIIPFQSDEDEYIHESSDWFVECIEKNRLHYDTQTLRY